METLVVVCVGLLGLLVGSFLNVVIWRVPRGESVVTPPSACPACGTRLGVVDLVPVVSWLALRGRCRTCGAPISGRYPLVEGLTGGLFALMALRFGWSWALPAYLVLTAFLVALSFIDLDTFRLPLRMVWASGLVGVVLLGAAAVLDGEPDRLWRMALGAAAAFAFFLLLHLVAPAAMGFGDVRLSAVLGQHLGWLGLLHVPVGLFLGFLYGAVVGVALIVAKRAGRKTAIPFGPYLAAGTLTAVLVGRPIIDWWLPS